ncbi:hypothetical protein F7725_014053 [Dissostichus mawsoni]|uniref:Uncharacterized protein n=1 Tax=Dissostichus mawsoni TaxID=36200 RepID=A0A7J5YV46_DISMA|nr:hypothetical protein F7725_014053 [Dissostichus mawsoni]
MKRNDFHRCHAFRGIVQHGSPATHRISPQPDVSAACMLGSIVSWRVFDCASVRFTLATTQTLQNQEVCKVL